MPAPFNSSDYTQAFAIAPSDAVPVQGPKQSDGSHAPYCRGIHVLTTGNLVCRFMDDRANSSVTIPVTAGQQLRYSLSFVYTASTATVLGLF